MDKFEIPFSNKNKRSFNPPKPNRALLSCREEPIMSFSEEWVEYRSPVITHFLSHNKYRHVEKTGKY